MAYNRLFLFIGLFSIIGASYCFEKSSSTRQKRTLGILRSLGPISHDIGHLLAGLDYEGINEPFYHPEYNFGANSPYDVYRPEYLNSFGYDYDFKK